MFRLRSWGPRQILSTTFTTAVTRSIVLLRSYPSIVSSERAATMAGVDKIPMIAQDVESVRSLVDKLASGKKTNNKKKAISCKKTTFEVEGSPAGLTVDSWRFQDWDYKRDDLPTYARGLFTTVNAQGQPEIAIRGYDKFFNHGEVPNTKWDHVEKNTKGPYELSLKENGCIIFISGLHDGTLLVCSKHSTGARGDVALSHAKAGERRLDEQLRAVGKTREDLARELRQRNATAVAELCDDDFEEHVLEYKGGAAGLYLHGINLNLPEFVTYSGAQVQQFATEWRFKKTDYLMLDDIGTTKTFLEEIAQTGAYNGRDLEGFVIRCKSEANSSGPYLDWFFKYKFEEPYLMYRQWRECTKSMISGKTHRIRKHVKITEEYLSYARRRLKQDPNLGKQYQQNHRIIELRDGFLKEKNLKGSDIIREEYSAKGGNPDGVNGDIILVPISTIGCGKTTIATALQHLFGWGHVQNDNITGSRRPPRFTKEVLTQLEHKPVVFADRNNALEHEREQILNDVHLSHPQVRLVALNFSHTPQTIDMIRKITQDRVVARGDNHQTIQAATDKKKVISIMEGFIDRYQPLNPLKSPDDEFDTVIELDPTAESRENLETVIGQLSSHYPKLFEEMPSSEDIDKAIKFALNEYTPTLRHEIKDRGPRFPKGRENKQEPQVLPQTDKKKSLEYMAVSVPKSDITDALEVAFRSVPSQQAQFFRNLQENGRVQNAFHVTLIHRAVAKHHPELWQRYNDILSEAGSTQDKLGSCEVLLERVVWDNRIMAIVVRIVNQEGGWTTVNPVAHITVGTKSNDVKPKESNDLLKRWLEIGRGPATGIGEVAIEGRRHVDGRVHGVLSR